MTMELTKEPLVKGKLEGELPPPVLVKVPVSADLGSPTGLSPSSTEKFEQCGLAYYFYAVARIVEPATTATMTGTFVHGVLETLLQLPPEQRTIAKAKELASAMRAEFCASEEFLSAGLDEAGTREWAWKSWRCIEAYFRLEDPARVEVESVEQFHETELNGVPVRGLTDRMDTTNGKFTVVDYKTGKAPNPGFASKKFPQLHFYAALIKATTGRVPDRVRLLYINGDDPVIIQSRTSEEEIAKVYSRVGDTWTQIQSALAAGEFEAKPTVLCGWCSHRAYCPAFGGDIAQAPPGKPRDEPLPEVVS